MSRPLPYVLTRYSTIAPVQQCKTGQNYQWQRLDVYMRLQRKGT